MTRQPSANVCIRSSLSRKYRLIRLRLLGWWTMVLIDRQPQDGADHH